MNLNARNFNVAYNAMNRLNRLNAALKNTAVTMFCVNLITSSISSYCPALIYSTKVAVNLVRDTFSYIPIPIMVSAPEV
ncbi:hypothetical protein HT594_00098 [Phenacoccus solenopsis nudivirus]|nr:hypothetical protein HT594_00098 [Phenacoccus solenopsis nudivirus]